MYVQELQSCCGVGELIDIRYGPGGGSYERSNPEKIIKYVCNEAGLGVKNVWDDDPRETLYGLYVFSDAVSESGKIHRIGLNLAKYIVDQGLGTVLESPAKINSVNHPEHKVKVWIWSVNKAALRAWNKAHSRVKA